MAEGCRLHNGCTLLTLFDAPFVLTDLALTPKIVSFITPLLSNLPQLQAIQIAASAQVNEDLYDSTDSIANSWRERAPSLKRVTWRDMSRWTKDSPTTGLLQFRLEGTRMLSEQITGSIEEVESLWNNMSNPPIQYLEHDIPFCFEQYAGTWRSAFIIMG